MNISQVAKEGCAIAKAYKSEPGADFCIAISHFSELPGIICEEAGAFRINHSW
jgi:hypothetical protein